MDRLYKGIFITLGFLIGLGLVFAVGFHTAEEVLSGTFNGDYIFNNDVTFNGNINGPDSIPSGFIGAFYLTTCPIGWKPADGTDSTPDLRGQFLRGLNSFDNSLTTRSDGKQDPDGGARILGDWQNHQIQSHSHYYKRILNSAAGGTSQPISSTGGTDQSQSTLYTGGTETRPKNVAIIYCIKE